MDRIVTLTQHGRESQVTYSEGPRTITGYQEFGGAAVVAIVSMGSADVWRVRHPWAVERRTQILRYVADELIRQQAPSDVATANPGLDPNRLGDTRGMDIIDGRLQIVADDRSAAWLLDPGTLKATPVAPRPVFRSLSPLSPTLNMATACHRVPDTLSEPVIVILDHASGQLTTYSLWQ